MPEFSPDAAVPASMPVLSRGKHRNPSRGACFMEYTALLAGEPVTDQPACVDGQLAAIMRGANDKLADTDRPLLVPLLGRAIGLGVGPPPTRRIWGRPVAERRRRREEFARHQSQALRLRREVSRRFMAALGTMPASATNVWSGSEEDVSWLFWDLMDQPTRIPTSAEYVRRLVDRLHLLHECYEQAVAQLGRPGTATAAAAPADHGSPGTTVRPVEVTTAP